MRKVCQHLVHVSKSPLCGIRTLHANAAQQANDAATLAPEALLGRWSPALPAAAAAAAASGLQHDVVHSIAAGLRDAGECVQSLWMAVPKKKACFLFPWPMPGMPCA